MDNDERPSILSKEMEKAIIGIVDKQLPMTRFAETLETHRRVYLEIEEVMKSLNTKIVDLQEMHSTMEEEIDDLKRQLSESVRCDQLEELVSKIMLQLIPSYNKKISKEIKKHFVALAEFIIENFKEEE